MEKVANYVMRNQLQQCDFFVYNLRSEFHMELTKDNSTASLGIQFKNKRVLEISLTLLLESGLLSFSQPLYVESIGIICCFLESALL